MHWRTGISAIQKPSSEPNSRWRHFKLFFFFCTIATKKKLKTSEVQTTSLLLTDKFEKWPQGMLCTNFWWVPPQMDFHILAAENLAISNYYGLFALWFRFPFLVFKQRSWLQNTCRIRQQLRSNSASGICPSR